MLVPLLGQLQKLLSLYSSLHSRFKMSLSVTVKSASSLPNVERFSKSDPMAVVIFQGIGARKNF